MHMPDDVMQDAMARLAADPNEFRRRKDIAMTRMAALLTDPPESVAVRCEFELDFSLAPAYEMCRAFYGMLLEGNPEADDMIVMYIFCQGLQVELRKIQELRDRLYKMGSLETQADALGMDLEQGEREILAAETDVVSSEPPTMDWFFRHGYVGTRCPKCRKRAVWHPVKLELVCLHGCGKMDDYDKRPGPELI